MTRTNKERRQIESRILNRIRRGNKILYTDHVEEVIYNYLMMVQNAKAVLEAELAAMNIDYEGANTNVGNNTNVSSGGWNAFYNGGK